MSAMPGATNPNARFSEAEVRNIRKLWRAGRRTSLELAERYGVVYGTINNIVYGRTYKCTNLKKISARQRLTQKGEKHNQHKLTNKQVRKIKKLLCGKRGEQAELGKQFNVSRRAVGDIKNKTTWTHIK